jgi:arylsulfatase A-like enzyme
MCIYGLSFLLKIMKQNNIHKFWFAVVAIYFTFYITSMTMTTMSKSSCILVENEKILEQPFKVDTLNTRQTEKTIDFIKQNSKNEFFVVLSFTNEKTKYNEFTNVLSELDSNVGKVLDTLKENKLDSNTIVLFTSTNGPHRIYGREAGNCGSFKGEIFRGNKGENYECGIRVPTLLRWSESIKEKSESSEVSSSLDIFPTLLDLVGEKPKGGNQLDGKSLLPQLLKNGQVSSKTLKSSEEDTNRDFLFHYCGDVITAVRYKSFKAHFWTPYHEKGEDNCPFGITCGCLGKEHVEPLLYNTDSNPSETEELKNEEVVRLIKKAKEEHEKAIVKGSYNHLLTVPNPLNFPCCSKEPLNHFTKIFKVLTNQCKC